MDQMKEPLINPETVKDGSENRELKFHGSTILGEPKEYTTNKIIGARYTWWNFLPKNLFEQFSNVANFYFLVIGVLQMCAIFTTTNRIPTQYEALAFIVLVSGIRAAAEDRKKHLQDEERNAEKYKILKLEGRREIWKDEISGKLKVGNIIKVKQNQIIPADMLLLGSQLRQGHCFIDKSNLNGETKYEVVSSIVATRSFGTNDDWNNFEGTLTYIQPNPNFSKFHGQLFLGNANQETVDLDGKILIMRETILRNCEYIYGLIVYTGKDTKIEMASAGGEKNQSEDNASNASG